jgi:hypothetical protein
MTYILTRCLVPVGPLPRGADVQLRHPPHRRALPLQILPGRRGQGVRAAPAENVREGAQGEAGEFAGGAFLTPFLCSLPPSAPLGQVYPADV